MAWIQLPSSCRNLCLCPQVSPWETKYEVLLWERACAGPNMPLGPYTIPYIVHYFWPEVVHYIRNRVPFFGYRLVCHMHDYMSQSGNPNHCLFNFSIYCSFGLSCLLYNVSQQITVGYSTKTTIDVNRITSPLMIYFIIDCIKTVCTWSYCWILIKICNLQLRKGCKHRTCAYHVNECMNMNK